MGFRSHSHMVPVFKNSPLQPGILLWRAKCVLVGCFPPGEVRSYSSFQFKARKKLDVSVEGCVPSLPERFIPSVSGY